MDGEKQKQVNKGNFRLMFVAHKCLCLGSIVSIVPVKNSNTSVVLFDIETTLEFIKGNVIFPLQR